MLNRYAEEGIVRLRLLLMLGLLFLAGHGLAQDRNFSFRSYDLSKHGTLELTVPRTWNDQLQPAKSKGALPSITLTSDAGTDFSLRLTPLWSTAATPEDDINTIRRALAAAIDDAKTVAVESEVALQSIDGTSGSGYYFSVTDRAPKPGEFKFMTQGMLQVGKLVLGFTILSNDGAEIAVAQAMTVVKTARLAQDATR